MFKSGAVHLKLMAQISVVLIEMYSKVNKRLPEACFTIISTSLSLHDIEGSMPPEYLENQETYTPKRST